MQPWRVLSSVLISSIVLLPQLAVAADDECGTAGTGEAAAEDYVKKLDTPYQLEQPFGGQDEISNLTEYIQVVYQFALGIMGIIAVVLIMFGGLRWIAAAGNESVITEAKEIITSAVTGLAIGLLSYVILAFINPQILNTDVTVFKIPIPLSCKNEPTLVNITSVTGLNGSGQACPNLITALQEVAIKMRTDSSNAASYCPTCTIQVSSAYRTPESQEPIYECYQKCVQEEYITSDGLTHLKSGTPAGCSYCAKAAKPCCSNHNKGTAVDLYFSVGGAAGMEDVPGSLAGDGANNNGKGGGVVNYAAGCSGSCDPEIFAAQKKLYDAMLSTGKFTNYKNEWWHFDYKGDCGTTASTTCTEVTDASGTKVASNAYCYTTNSANTPLYRYATCTGGTASCVQNWGGYTWYVLSAGDCDSTVFSGEQASAPSQTYLTKPSCRRSNSTTATGGSCPFVVVDTEEGSTVDNNILPQSQDVLGDQMVQDLYQLRYPPAITDHQTYRISIQEWEQEETQLDQVRLWLVPGQTNLAVTQENTIVAYQSAGTVRSCTFNGVTPCEDTVSHQDTTTLRGEPGDIVEIALNRTSDAAVSFQLYARGRDYQPAVYTASPKSAPISVAMMQLAVKSIQVEVLTRDGAWMAVQKLHPREYWSYTELVNLSHIELPTGPVQIRLTWTGHHDLDLAQLVTTEPVINQRLLPLVSAQHTTTGAVLSKVMREDAHSVTLQPGERIDLEFFVPSQLISTPGSLFLESRGYYYRLLTPDALAQ